MFYYEKLLQRVRSQAVAYTNSHKFVVGALAMQTRSIAKIIVHSRVNGFQANLDFGSG